MSEESKKNIRKNFKVELKLESIIIVIDAMDKEEAIEIAKEESARRSAEHIVSASAQELKTEEELRESYMQADYVSEP